MLNRVIHHAHSKPHLRKGFVTNPSPREGEGGERKQEKKKLGFAPSPSPRKGGW